MNKYLLLFRQPYLLTGLIFGLFLAVVKLVNISLIRQGILTHLPWTFPFSVAKFHLQAPNLLLALLFLLAALAAILLSSHIRSAAAAVLIGWLLILLGSLSQGGVEKAFIQPFTASGIQYYHDALAVDDSTSFLNTFNEAQSTLGIHARTHPPFAVLSHYWLLQAGDGHPWLLSAVFSLASLLSLALLAVILGWLKTPRQRQIPLLLLAALLPAVNIYTIVSLDGVILLFASLYLAGMVAWAVGKHPLVVLSLLTIGLAGMNLLSFGGLFLFALGGLYGLYQLFIHKRRDLLKLYLASAAIVGLLLLLLYVDFKYNHLQAFLTASATENPGGFALFHHPLRYFVTRFEGIIEVLVFLGLPAAGFLLRRSAWQKPHLSTPGSSLALTALAVFLLMLLTGAYQTGETARAGLFLYPFFILLLNNTFQADLKPLMLLTALQTAVMQGLWSFFW